MRLTNGPVTDLNEIHPMTWWPLRITLWPHRSRCWAAWKSSTHRSVGFVVYRRASQLRSKGNKAVSLIIPTSRGCPTADRTPGRFNQIRESRPSGRKSLKHIFIESQFSRLFVENMTSVLTSFSGCRSTLWLFLAAVCAVACRRCSHLHASTHRVRRCAQSFFTFRRNIIRCFPALCLMNISSTRFRVSDDFSLWNTWLTRPVPPTCFCCKNIFQFLEFTPRVSVSRLLRPETPALASHSAQHHGRHLKCRSGHWSPVHLSPRVVCVMVKWPRSFTSCDSEKNNNNKKKWVPNLDWRKPFRGGLDLQSSTKNSKRRYATL